MLKDIISPIKDLDLKEIQIRECNTIFECNNTNPTNLEKIIKKTNIDNRINIVYSSFQ